MRSNSPGVAADVDIHRAADGSVILCNKVPLASSITNLSMWLHQHAATVPDRLFLQERDRQGAWHGISYAQILARVNRLSNGLVAMGLDGTRPIAILSENSINMAIIQLAAMQVGLTVVPISYAYSVRSQSGSHIKHILDVSNATMLIMSDAKVHMGKLDQWDTRDLELYAFCHSASHANVRPWTDLYGEHEVLSAESQARFEAVTADTLAKIQFTSGSTNLPKGVEVTHGMMVTNQVGISQMWPFLDSHEVVVDWLPWHHTFGGNFVFNMVLMHGGTLYIDHGNPTPAGLTTTIQNIIDVLPTLYFSVPRGYTALYARMQNDEALKHAFFAKLKFVFTAAAALDQATYEGMKAMSAEVRDAPVPFFSGWGCTETAPDATLVYWPIDDARVIGLPIPGVNIKLTPDPSGKLELRVKGPNVTPGYYHNEAATTAAFDQEGFYCTGDAGAFLNPEQPAAGLIFDGRIGEDFKLTSGVWVHNGQLRSHINKLGQPFLIDVVIAAPNRDYLTALVFPNLPILRERFAIASQAHPEDADFLRCQVILELFRHIFQQHNSIYQSSNGRFERFVLLTEPPQIDDNETTDKGYINQSAVLRHRNNIVNNIYIDPISGDIVSVDI